MAPQVWYLFFTYWTFIITLVVHLYPPHPRITTLPLNIICLFGLGDVIFTNIPAIQLYSFCMHVMPFAIARRNVNIVNKETILFSLFVIILYILFIHGWCKKNIIEVYKECLNTNTNYSSLMEMMNDRFG